MTEYRVTGKLGKADDPVTVFTETFETHGHAQGVAMGCEAVHGWRDVDVVEVEA